MIQDIGIIDTKKIIASIKENYNYNFRDYSLTTFKRRILNVVNQSNYTSISDFINRLDNPSVFNKIIDEISINDTEMFRDPPLWRELRDKHLNDLYKNRDFKIWFPDISSGDELFSLAIVLHEIGLLKNTKIMATGISQNKLNQIKKGGLYEIKKIENGEANYKRYSDQNQLNDYYKIVNNKITFDTELIKNVDFSKQNVIDDNAPGNFHMVLYRNKMIYFNLPLQDKVASKIIDAIIPGGILCIGNKESLDETSLMKKVMVLNKEEKIFKKRVI